MVPIRNLRTLRYGGQSVLPPMHHRPSVIALDPVPSRSGFPPLYAASGSLRVAKRPSVVLSRAASSCRALVIGILAPSAIGYQPLLYTGSSRDRLLLLR